MRDGSDFKVYFHFGRKKSETTNGVYVGALVELQKNASFWNGTRVENWYYHYKWVVTELDGNKATLGKDESGKYKMKLPISTNFLTVVKRPDDEDHAVQG